MNTVDKKVVGGIALIGTIGTLYMVSRLKKGKPVTIMGLNAEHSLKFVSAVTLLSGAVLAWNAFKPATA